MVSHEGIKNRVFSLEMQPTLSKGSAQVTMSKIQEFDERLVNLRIYIGDVIDAYAKEHNIKPKYDGIEELTHLSVSQIKQMINGRTNITRTSLYKLVVGLKMSLEEANKLFRMFNGELTEDCLEDYICIRALEDGDDMTDFITEYNQYTKGNKLKDPLA